MRHRPRFVLRLVGLLLLAGIPGVPTGPAEVAAACLRAGDVRAVRRALRETARCRLAALRRTAPTCPDRLPESAAGVLARNALVLALGPAYDAVEPVDASQFRPQLACQRAILRAVTSHFVQGLAALAAGEPTDGVASRQLARAAARCAVRVVTDPGGTVLPAVGAPCDTHVGGDGAVVAPDALRECLRTNVASAIAALGASAGPTTVIVVRHAERDPGFDPPLTAEGEARAAALGTALAGARVTNILTTQFIRNQQTATAVSLATGAPVTTVQIDPAQDWPYNGHVMSAAVLALPRGGVILVVGHSSGFNSALVQDLGAPAVAETYAAISILTLDDDGPTRILRAEYGGRSSLDP